MPILSLDNICLVCISSVMIPESLIAIRKSIAEINFGSVKFLTDYIASFTNFEVVNIPKIISKQHYCQFVMKDLYKFIDKQFVLIVQWDGYVLNSAAWTEEFLQYDYIGAPWIIHNDEFKVGNGGFSLRSKKLMEFLATDPNIIDTFPEDGMTCRIYRPYLESKGFKYAPIPLAYKFAVENEVYKGQFGWHGGETPRTR